MRRVAMGFLAACAAQLALLPALWTIDQPVPPSFFFANFAVLLLVQCLAALVFGKPGRERTWAALVFALPICLALYPLAERFALGTGHSSIAGAAVVAAGGGVFWVLWSFFGPRPAAPILAAMLGSGVGTAFLYFLYEYYRGAQTAGLPLAILAAFALASFLIALLAGKIPIPRMPAGFALGLGLSLLIAASLAAPLDLGPRISPPADVVADAEKPSVVLIVLDTVRADRLASYGSPRNTMPQLERFARESAVTFEQAVANSPWTLPTHASLFTGLVPARHGAHSPFEDDSAPPASFYPLAVGSTTLAYRLSQAGYWTFAVVANSGPLATFFGLDLGFHFYRADVPAAYLMKRYTPWRAAGDGSWPLDALDALPLFERPSFFGRGEWVRNAEDISDEAIALVDRAGDHPFFLFVNYIDAHAPYTPHSEFLEQPLAEPPTERLKDWKVLSSEVIFGRRSLTAEEGAYLLDVYDSELGYLDRHLGRLLERLARHPRWNEMMVIVTSDHGEAFGEHGLVAHGLNLYEELLRVPLFIKAGGGTAGNPVPEPGSHVSAPAQSVDVFPTVLEHVGLSVPSDLDGLAWARGRSEAMAWLYWPQSAAATAPGRFDHELRSVSRDGWKLIESSRFGTQLYDLRSDPLELEDRSEAEPAVRDSLRSALGPGEQEPMRKKRAQPRRSRAVPRRGR